MSEIMKAISLWQPWAQLVAIGAKQFETRGWATKYRGPIAIHAAKKPVLPIMESLPVSTQVEMFLCLYDYYKINGSVIAKMKEALGCVIAVDDLVDCIPCENFTYGGTQQNLQYQEKLFGDWTPGRYAWQLENVKILPEPIPAKGQQGLWNWEVSA